MLPLSCRKGGSKTVLSLKTGFLSKTSAKSLRRRLTSYKKPYVMTMLYIPTIWRRNAMTIPVNILEIMTSPHAIENDARTLQCIARCSLASNQQKTVITSHEHLHICDLFTSAFDSCLCGAARHQPAPLPSSEICG